MALNQLHNPSDGILLINEVAITTNLFLEISQLGLRERMASEFSKDFKDEHPNASDRENLLSSFMRKAIILRMWCGGSQTQTRRCWTYLKAQCIC